MWFILSEEDKATDVALAYWFRAVDLDGDGALSPPEMLYFYEEQLHRMECLSQVRAGGGVGGGGGVFGPEKQNGCPPRRLGPHLYPPSPPPTTQEPVQFADVLCQLHDMIGPSKEGSFTLADLRARRGLAGTLFNILFNLNKFVAFETRDPFLVRAEREDGGGEWDRFARAEYVRLAMEEEGGGGAGGGGGNGGGGDGWDSLEAPF